MVALTWLGLGSEAVMLWTRAVAAVSAVDWPCLCLYLLSVLKHRFSLGHLRFRGLLCFLLPPLKIFPCAFTFALGKMEGF